MYAAERSTLLEFKQVSQTAEQLVHSLCACPEFHAEGNTNSNYNSVYFYRKYAKTTMMLFIATIATKHANGLHKKKVIEKFVLNF